MNHHNHSPSNWLTAKENVPMHTKTALPLVAALALLSGTAIAGTDVDTSSSAVSPDEVTRTAMVRNVDGLPTVILDTDDEATPDYDGSIEIDQAFKFDASTGAFVAQASDYSETELQTMALIAYTGAKNIESGSYGHAALADVSYDRTVYGIKLDPSVELDDDRLKQLLEDDDRLASFIESKPFKVVNLTDDAGIANLEIGAINDGKLAKLRASVKGESNDWAYDIDVTDVVACINDDSSIELVDGIEVPTGAKLAWIGNDRLAYYNNGMMYVMSDDGKAKQIGPDYVRGSIDSTGAPVASLTVFETNGPDVKRVHKRVPVDQAFGDTDVQDLFKQAA